MSETSLTIWERLGLAPTQDRGAIRRAYAERLRGIDQDRDPEGFMALRNAFTLALREAAEPAAPPPAPERPPAASEPPESAEETARIKAYAQQFAEAGRAGRAEDAYTAYQALLALGAVNAPGGVHPAAVQMAILAARDPALRLERVDAILRALRLDAVGLDRLKSYPEIAGLIQQINHRMVAENWLKGLQIRAAEKLLTWQGFRDRRKIIAARYLLGTWPVTLGVAPKLIQNEMKNADQYAAWLAGAFMRPARLDPARRGRNATMLDATAFASLVCWSALYLCAVAGLGIWLGTEGVWLAVLPFLGANLFRRFSHRK